MGRKARLVALTLVVAVLLLGGLISFPLVTRSAPPPAWRVELEHYLAYQAGLGTEQASVIATSHATLPWLFDEGLSKSVFMANAFDPTDTTYQKQLASPFTLPFPPADLWCVLLQRDRSSTASTARQVVFVAEHESLYSGYWVVHEGPTSPFKPQLAGDLARLGCALPIRP